MKLEAIFWLESLGEFFAHPKIQRTKSLGPRHPPLDFMRLDNELQKE